MIVTSYGCRVVVRSGVLAVVWAAVLSGCSDLGGPLRAAAPADARCDIRPASIDFGNIAVGQSGEQSFRVANVGSVSLNATLALSCAGFTFVSGGGAHAIAPGESLTVTVRYTPTTGGPSSCTILTGLPCSGIVASASGFVPATVSFATDIQVIFTTSCVGCHGSPQPSGGADLTAGSSYASLVDAVSNGYAPAVRVIPGDTTHSVLYHKVFGTGQYGPAMPLGGTISQSDRIKIRTWITEGARDN